MTTLFFVVPVHGRYEKTRACLRQLARTRSALEGDGIQASAVVVGGDDNLEVAEELGFLTVRAANKPLGRKWNDGYELAGHAGADFVVPFGSDDWVDPAMFLDLPDDMLRCSKRSSVVREDGNAITELYISYEYGDGVRVTPKALMEKVDWRPAEDHRERAIDTSIIRRMTKVLGKRPPALYHDYHPYQIVDWKSDGDQLNSYAACCNFRRGQSLDPWEVLVDRYPAEALDEMRAVYGLPVEATA